MSGRVLKNYVKRIMNEENDWDHMEEDAIGGAVDYASREKMVLLPKEMKTVKTLYPQIYYWS